MMSVFDVDLVLPALDGYDILDDDHLVDVSVGDLDVDALVYLLVDALVDVLGLHSHCRCQLACCRCSCSVYDGLPDVDASVETTLLHMMLLLDGSTLCLDAILHDDVDDDTTLDALLLANSNDAIHDVGHDPNLHDDVANDATLLLDILPIDDPIPLLRCLRWDPGIQDVVVQSCYRRCDVEVHDDERLLMVHSLPSSSPLLM